ncbi:MAG: hypothetical protein GY725_07180 [bacterium]|nr:hypothetical protein [bacterium]
MTPEPTKPERTGPSPVVILLSVFAALLMTCATAGYMFVNSERGQELVKGAQELVELVTQAQNAPGAEELRALGCDQAMIMDVGRMMQILGTLGGVDPPDLGEDVSDDTLMVLCSMNSSSAGAPTCEQIASTYAAASNATQPFVIFAGENEPESSEQACQGLYSPYGELLSELEEDPALQ